MRRAAFAATPWVLALALRVWGGARPAQVEAHFSRGAYPHIAAFLAAFSARVSWSVAEVVCALALASGLAWALRRLRRAKRSTPPARGRIGRVATRTVGVLGVAYVLFLVVWGLNYERLPLAVNLGLDERPSDPEELRTLAEALVLRANALREGLPEGPAGALALAGGQQAALGRVAAGFAGVAGRLPLFPRSPGRVKAPLVSPLLSYLGIAGIYIPFTAEPHVNGTLPDSEIPFTASHEMAHEQGFAREDEANYVGYLACRAHPEAAFRYSGELRASLYLTAALHGVDPRGARALAERRSPAVRRDLAALNAWYDRYASRASEVQRRVNDAYLRSQGQAQGVRSYGRVVDLLLAEQRANRDRPRAPGGP